MHEINLSLICLDMFHIGDVHHARTASAESFIHHRQQLLFPEIAYNYAKCRVLYNN